MPGGHCGTRRGRLQEGGDGEEEISISPNPAPNPICPDGVIPPRHPTPNPRLVLGALHITLSPHPSSVELPSISEPSPPTPQHQRFKTVCRIQEPKLQDRNLRTGRSQEVILVNVPPPSMCIPAPGQTVPSLQVSLSSLPLQFSSNANDQLSVCVLPCCYFHPFKSLVGR